MSSFWIEKPSVLWENYQDFIPKKSMNRIEQLNAISRLLFYIIIILLLFGFSSDACSIPLVLLLFVIVLYYIYINDPGSNIKEDKLKRTQIEDYNSNADVFYEGNPQAELESGYYDSNQNLILGPEYSVHTKRDKDLLFTFDEFTDMQNKKCRKPTPDNPFMNPKITDYNTQNPPEACNADDVAIQGQIDDSFQKGLYSDIDDLFNIKNSQRAFYTVMVPGIPNDQKGFADWCYKTPLTCKENQEGCLRYEDIRYTSVANGYR